ncbi:hypothetical protein SK128_020651 [Halocaridina rubra]|uniref:Uncharacterized protein n=1 Tax=Halocaridina rubra TaxID=373956 RepID=A0AAN9AAM6_HALRR
MEKQKPPSPPEPSREGEENAGRHPPPLRMSREVKFVAPLQRRNSDTQEYVQQRENLALAQDIAKQPKAGTGSIPTRDFGKSVLKKLKRRATVTPDFFEKQNHDEFVGSDHLPMQTFLANSNLEAAVPSTSYTNRYFLTDENGDESHTNSKSSINDDNNNNSNELGNPTAPQQFRKVVQESTALLNEISRKSRKRRPCWEGLVRSLRALWLNEPYLSRRSSVLLFWHIDPRDGVHISTKARADGEYVVAINENKPKPTHQNSILKFLFP